MTPDRFAKHVAELADAFEVVIHEIAHGQEARAMSGLLLGFIPVKMVEIAPVVDETTYAIALHELGHLCAPNGSIDNKTRTEPAMVMLAERSAWEWARYYAMVWTDQMERVQEMALGTYEAAKSSGMMDLKHARTARMEPQRHARPAAPSAPKVKVGSASDFAKKIKIGGW